MTKLLKVFRGIYKLKGVGAKGKDERKLTKEDVLTRCQNHRQINCTCSCRILNECFEAIIYVDVQDRRVCIYGEGKKLLYDYRGALSELKDCITLHQKDSGYYFHRSFILNLNVFRDIPYSSLTNKIMIAHLAVWNAETGAKLLGGIRSKIKILRK